MSSIIKFLWGSSEEPKNDETVESLKEILKLLKQNKISNAIIVTKDTIAEISGEIVDDGNDDETSDDEMENDPDYKTSETNYKRMD